MPRLFYRSGAWVTWLSELERAARLQGKAARVNLKVDSGLGRLGIAVQDAQALLARLQSSAWLEIHGAYSHLAAAEELDSHYTLEQVSRFAQAVPSGSVPQRHIAASAAAMMWPQTRFDLVRVGIAVYGIWPSSGCPSPLGHNHCTAASAELAYEHCCDS